MHLNNELPEEFCFFNTRKHPRKDEIIERFNNLFNRSPYKFVLNYYGVIKGLPTAFSDKTFLSEKVKEITEDDFLKLTEPNHEIMEKKLKGYKYKSFVSKNWIAGVCNYTIFDVSDSFILNPDSKDVEKLREAGVLDIWCDEVYEEEKTIITLRCKGGTFNLEVSEKGIYYAEEKVFLNIECLEKLCEFKNFTLFTDKENIIYSCGVDYVNLGCKKEALLEDVCRVVREYKKIKEQ